MSGLLKYSLLFVLLVSGLVNMYAQQEGVKQVACIGFYNLENLFDTFDDPNINDEEFLPGGKKQWDFEKYNAKLKNMASVIQQLGGKNYPYGPAILGVCEVENKQVLKDLVAMPQIANRKYSIVHHDSPDKRGIDVALIYQPRFFKVIESKAFKLTIPGRDDFFSRDQLLVTGTLDGERLHVIVNHWPSRYGGEKESRPLRMEAAKLCLSIVDSINTAEKDAKILVMGDFNDDPDNVSVKKVLNGKKYKLFTTKGELYNPMYRMFKQGAGSLQYRDKWNLFDQILVSKALLKNNEEAYSFNQAKVYDENYLKVQEGRYAGYPFRTFVGKSFHGGYSDHLPVYIYLIKNPRTK